MPSREDAEDITSEVFIRAWKYFDEAKNINVKRWLHLLLNSIIIDRSRKKSTAADELDPEETSQLILKSYTAQHADKDPADIMAEKERVILVKKACEQLSKKERAVIHFAAKGYTISEIADAVGLRKASVQSYLNRAKTKIKIYAIRKDK